MCDQPAHMSSLIRAFASLLNVLNTLWMLLLLTDNHLEFLSLKGGCTCSSKSTLVKMPHCWKSHVTGRVCMCAINFKFGDLHLFPGHMVNVLKF